MLKKNNLQFKFIELIAINNIINIIAILSVKIEISDYYNNIIGKCICE